MERKAVDSSNIVSIGYDPATKVLEVEFHYGGAIYQYFEVPQEIYDGLMAAESQGKFLNASVKGTYEYERV